MSGTRAKPRVHYNMHGFSRPEGHRGPVRGQCGEYIDDPRRVTDDWLSVPEEDRCIRCSKSLRRTDVQDRLDRILFEAERDPEGSVPAHLIITIARPG